MNSKWKIEPVSLLEKAMQSVAVNDNFKTTPYERKTLDRAMGILKSLSLTYLKVYWKELNCSGEHQLSIILYHFPIDTDQKVLAAETAMSRAFRAASVGKGSTAVSVDGQVFYFPTIFITFKKAKNMRRASK